MCDGVLYCVVQLRCCVLYCDVMCCGMTCDDVCVCDYGSVRRGVALYCCGILHDSVCYVGVWYVGGIMLCRDTLKCDMLYCVMLRCVVL